jgi:hypothetical protein
MFTRRSDDHRDCDQQRHDARINPELLPLEWSMNQGSDNKLAGGPAEHAEALGNPDSGGEITRRKTTGREINRCDKREGGTGALQEPPHARDPAHVHGEHRGADGKDQQAGRYRVFRAPAVDRSAGYNRECRVGIIVKPDQRAQAHRVQAERSRELGQHDARCRAHRVFHEVEQQAEKPGDDESFVERTRCCRLRSADSHRLCRHG